VTGQLPGSGQATGSGQAPIRGTHRRLGFLRLLTIVARRDYVRAVRRRGFLFGTLLLPIGLGGLLGLSSFFSSASFAPGGGAASPGPTLVVNESALRLTVTPATAPGIQLLDRDAAMSSLLAGKTKEFYVIPTTYPATPEVQRIEASNRSQGLDSVQRQQQQEQILGVVLRNALLADAQIPPQIAQRVLNPAEVISRTVDGRLVTPGSAIASFLLPYAFTLLFVMSIFITSGYLLQSVTEEKENRVVEIILSSVPALPLMAGKILGLGAVGLTQVVIWVATSIVALPLLNQRLSVDVHISSLTLVLAMIYFALGYLAYGAIFSAIGALAPGSREAQQYAGFFGFLAVVPLIFTGVFLTDLGSPIVWVLSLIPLTAPATMLQVLTLAEDPPWLQIGLSIASLGTFVLLATLASARVFRATLLLYGVRPSLGRIVDAVFARN
jgi:ABC-2 type transport system permease protein